MRTTVADDDAVPAVRETRRVKWAEHVQALHRVEALERERDELRAENERLRVAVEYRIRCETSRGATQVSPSC